MTVSGKAFDISILKKLFVFVAPYKSVFYLSVALMILIACVAPAPALLIKDITDHCISFKDAQGLLKMTLIDSNTLKQHIRKISFCGYINSQLHYHCNLP